VTDLASEPLDPPHEVEPGIETQDSLNLVTLHDRRVYCTARGLPHRSELLSRIGDRFVAARAPQCLANRRVRHGAPQGAESPLHDLSYPRPAVTAATE